MSNQHELPLASSEVSISTPIELLSKVPPQPSAEFTTQPLPSLKLSLSIPKSLLESAPDVKNDNKDAGIATSTQSAIEMPHPFSNWNRNCYTLYEVDEKVSSPNARAHVLASSGINSKDSVTMHPYEAITISPFIWKYQGFRNISSENQTIKVKELLSKTRGQKTYKEINASLANTSVESDLEARRTQSSMDLHNLEGVSSSFGQRRNLSASDLKALVGSIFNVGPNASGVKSKSVPATPMSSPKSQRKVLALQGEQTEIGEVKYCPDLKAAGALSPSQPGNTEHYKVEDNTPIHSNKTGLRKNTHPATMLSSIVDWATKKPVTVSNAEMNIFIPPGS